MAITCDEIIKETKSIPIGFNEKKIAVSVYCYLIKCEAKRKKLLQCYTENSKLKKVLY